MLSFALDQAIKRNDYESMSSLFLSDTKTSLTVKFLKNDFHFADDKEKRDIYKITLKRGSRSFSFNFGQSINNSSIKKENRIEPSDYDILACLTKYEVGTLENFCSEFGYDTDSKRADKIYTAVLKEFAMVQTLWTDAEIEVLQEIN
jgi:hypothetical protein